MSLTCSNRVSYEQVIQPVQPTRQTSTYRPIQNRDLLEMLAAVALTHGLDLKNPQFGETKERQRMFGVYEVGGRNHFDNQVRLMLGVRNAFDGMVSASICFGSEVFVCSNMIFTGYANGNGVSGGASHRHVSNSRNPSLTLRLRDRVDMALGQVDKFINFQNKFYGRLRDTKLNDNRASRLIIEAARQNVIPKKDILTVSDEWNLPVRGPKNEEEQAHFHEEFKPRNAWSLHNAFTEYAKAYTDQNLVVGSQRLIGLTKFFTSQFPLTN